MTQKQASEVYALNLVYKLRRHLDRSGEIFELRGMEMILLRSGGGFPCAQACHGSPPPRGSFFWLGPKETKTQGLELMSDKFVKALLVVSTSSDEGSERAR